MTTHHLHRRRLHRLHEEHRRRRPAAPGARRRRDPPDGHRPPAARGSEVVVGKLAQTLGVPATVKTYRDQRAALDGADFVVVAFQIGGYEPCTVTDFEVPKKFGLRQTIADTLGIGGIMRGLRTVPHLWKICEDMRAGLPRRDHAPVRQPDGDQHLGDRREVPATSARSASATRCRAPPRSSPATSTSRSRRSATAPPASTTWPSTSNFEHRSCRTAATATSTRRCARATPRAASPSPSHWNPRCPNKVRYEMMTRLGYFVTESSEHFAEYMPWFIKRDRPDLIERFGIPLDEYPKRCIENIARWEKQAEAYSDGRHDRGRGEPRIRQRDRQLGRRPASRR